MCAGGGRDTRSSGERNRVARFSSKQAVFLHKKTFSSQQENFLQSKINFFSQGKECQVEGCSCTYCLPDKKMERLVIGICPTQNSLSGQLDNWTQTNEVGEIHLPLKFGENEELKIAAAEIWCLDRLCQRGFPDSLAKAFGRAAIWWNILFFWGQKCAFFTNFSTFKWMNAIPY